MPYPQQVTPQVFLSSWGVAKEAKIRDPRLQVITTADNSPWNGDFLFPLTDPGIGRDDASNFGGAVDKLLELTKTGQKVLVHSVSGASRSIAVLMAYLVKSEGLTLEQAFAQLAEIRKGIMPYYIYLELVASYCGLPPIEDFSQFWPKALEGEAQTVNNLYLELLLRPADPDGLEHYSFQLKYKILTPEALEKVLRESPEYREKHPTGSNKAEW